MSGYIKGPLIGLFDPITNALRGFFQNDNVEQGSFPYVVAQSGTPIIVLPSGTFNTTGQLTLGTALPYTPVGTVNVYLYAGNGLAAGLYQATFGSTTVCQLVGNPTTTSGAYAGGTTSASLLNVPVPGGAMGPNGSLSVKVQVTAPNNANNKNLYINYGGSSIFGAGLSSFAGLRVEGSIANRGAQNRNVTSANSASGYGSCTLAVTSVDTSQTQTVDLRFFSANAADYMIIESWNVTVYPG